MRAHVALCLAALFMHGDAHVGIGMDNTHTELCNWPLVERLAPDSFRASSVLSASHSPIFAKLNHRDGAGGWAPAHNDQTPWLQLELSGRTEVTALATQGLYGSSDWASSYLLLYGDSAENWRQYQEDGNAWVFPGNKNSNKVVRHELQSSIVTRFLRFVPIEWNPEGRIGLRVELYGCPYRSSVAYFDGRSLLAYRFEHKVRRTRKDVVSLRMRTKRSDGVLLHGEGQRGDGLILQIHRGRLHLHLSLGRDLIGMEGDAGEGMGYITVSAGSLLDDQHWHDVTITRSGRHGNLTVDRHMQRFRVMGDYESLDLDYQLSFGGLPLGGKPGNRAHSNFIGCMENVYYNGEDVTDLARRAKPQIYITGNVMFGCPAEVALGPVTFPSPGGYLALAGHLLWPNHTQPQVQSLGLQFRTWDAAGLLLQVVSVAGGHGVEGLRLALSKGNLHMTSSLHLRGRTELLLVTGSSLNDGEWHGVMLQVRDDSLLVVVDGREHFVMFSPALHLIAGNTYYFGGYPQSAVAPFLGCMRLIQMDNQPVDITLLQQGLLGTFINVHFDLCGITDRCLPNHCEHGGRCMQTWGGFSCDCQGTSYTGSTCHMPAYELSCEAYKHLGWESGHYWVDPDGSGPLGALLVFCNMTEDKVWTTVTHENMKKTVVQGANVTQPFLVIFTYGATAEQLAAIVASAEHCQQEVAYYCKRSRMFNASDGEPHTSWVGRTHEKQRYWSGAVPRVQKCACGITKNCSDPKFFCNCEGYLYLWKEDSGLLGYKPHLPVLQLIIGDMNRSDSEAAYRVGPLRCHGDRHFWNAASFSTHRSYLHFLPVYAETSLDITFLFKTSAESGVFLENMGTRDFIRVQLKSPYEVSFGFDVGNGPVEMVVRSGQTLNDEEWHAVSVERSLKEASVRVDRLPRVVAWVPSRGHAHLQLNSQLYIGSSVSGYSGFLGCVRSLRVNGVMLDLEEQARVTPGVNPGCSGHCRSYGALCRNGGRCVEHSVGYSCDCSSSPYDGPFCTAEVGGFFERGTWVRYEFQDPHKLLASTGSDKDTLPFERASDMPVREPSGDLISPRVPVSLGEPAGDSESGEMALFGFSTRTAPAMLLHVSSKSGSCLTVTLQSNGSLQIRYSRKGGQRTKVIHPDPRSVADGQPHSLNITRQDSFVRIQLDHYPQVKCHLWGGQNHFNPSTLFLGKVPDLDVNDHEVQQANVQGFVGCLSRVQFNSAAPLKAALRQRSLDIEQHSSSPAPIASPVFVQGRLVESTCMALPMTTVPPTTSTDLWSLPVTTSFVSREDGKPQSSPISSNTAIVGGVIAMSILVILCMLVGIVRYLFHHKGTYRTNEAKGLEAASATLQSEDPNFPESIDESRKEYLI
ncbi:contactin-associated protein-like 2 [Lampetra fluviatilis]